MAFTDIPERGAMLVMLNGEGPSAPLVRCPRCGKPMLRVFTTAGTRRVDPTMPPHQDVCINPRWISAIPCPNALEAKGLIDRLMEASRR